MSHTAYAFSQVGGGRDVRPEAAGRSGEGGCGGRHRVAGVRRFHDPPDPPACGDGPKRGLRDPALGRSRGGLTSKIHLACDSRGRPLAFVVTGGDTNDCTRFTTVMDASECPGSDRDGPVPGPIASWATRATARKRSARGSAAGASRTRFPSCRPGRQTGPARPPTSDREVCKHRNVVERCFNRLKQWRGIATRYDKTAQSYEAAATLASLLMWA
ncbi:IS5 family transposase [Streptomyces sp. CB02115]|uniref:IS5 family transposase n=1 Tax=Streptomyces sp. CB02115 TaxID=1703939 RepID=UPI003FD2D5CE